MYKSNPRGDVLLASVLLLTCVACIAITGWQLIVPGPFDWHVGQPQFWQGGIEALALICLLAATQLLPRRTLRIGLTLVLAELYLRRHGVDAAVLVDLVYLELTIALGAFVMRHCAAERPHDIPGYLASFVIGLCTWSICAWVLSAIGFGSLHDLRWITLLLLIPGVAARSRPWIVFVNARVESMPRGGRLFAGILLAWFLVQFARSAVAIDFDSLWYGLRGQYVLVGGGSAFASSGLVSPVYYFPKLYELYLIPLSGLGSSSVVTGMTLLIGTLLSAAAYHLLKLLGVGQSAIRLMGVAACITVPAIGNQLLEAKGDILAALLLTYAWIKAAQLVTTRTHVALIWMASLLLLSTQARLSAIPFAAAISVATLLAYLLRPTAPAQSQRQESRLAWTTLGLIIIVAAFVTVRTFLLAGMPTIGPDPLFKLWQGLGFHLKFPAGTLHWRFPKDWGDVFPLIIDYLFRPERLSHIQISWVGNIWAWLTVTAVLAMLIMRKRPRLPGNVVRPGVGMALAGIILMLCWGYQIRGGDGNYFIAGLVPAILLGFAAAWSTLAYFPRSRVVFLACIGAFCLFQSAYGFMSAAWITGTRPFDMVMTRGVREFRQREHAIWNYYGIARIANYLRAQHNADRVVGYVDSDPGFALPAIFEGLADISYARPQLVEDRELFLKFLSDTRVKYLIMPNARHKSTSDATKFVSPMITKLARQLNAMPARHVVTDSNYDMYDVSHLNEVIPGRQVQPAASSY